MRSPDLFCQVPMQRDQGIPSILHSFPLLDDKSTRS